MRGNKLTYIFIISALVVVISILGGVYLLATNEPSGDVVSIQSEDDGASEIRENISTSELLLESVDKALDDGAQGEERAKLLYLKALELDDPSEEKVNLFRESIDLYPSMDKYVGLWSALNGLDRSDDAKAVVQSAVDYSNNSGVVLDLNDQDLLKYLVGKLDGSNEVEQENFEGEDVG